jgi:hypothetical protein
MADGATMVEEMWEGEGILSKREPNKLYVSYFASPVTKILEKTT